MLGTKSKFNYRGRKYAWRRDKELYAVATKEVLARYVPENSGRKKKGVMYIFEGAVEMIELVMAAGIVMLDEWYDAWEEDMPKGSYMDRALVPQTVS